MVSLIHIQRGKGDKERVENITKSFAYLEIIGKHEGNRLFNDKRIKGIYLRKGKSLPDKEVPKLKANAERVIKEVANFNMNINIDHKDETLTNDKGDVFFKLSDGRFVSKKKLDGFIQLPFQYMSDEMKYIA